MRSNGRAFQDIEIKCQERLCIERRRHCPSDRITREETLLFKLIEHLKCSPHTRTLQDLSGKRTRLAITNSSKRLVTDAKQRPGFPSRRGRRALADFDQHCKRRPVAQRQRETDERQEPS